LLRVFDVIDIVTFVFHVPIVERVYKTDIFSRYVIVISRIALVCTERPSCEHGIVVCQCVSCWDWPSQCPYTYKVCDHNIPTFSSCDECKRHNFPDPEYESELAAMDMGRPETNEGRIAEHHERSGDKDMDMSEKVRRKGDVGSPSNYEPIPESDIDSEHEGHNNPHTQLQTCVGTVESASVTLPDNGS